jgi:BirA family biotin operon repressor/biotin-[acetyl-CoA-carboxylase] ligase
MKISPGFVGKNHQHFQSIESTHIFLNDILAKTNPPEGFCVSSDFQSGGRGQIGRNWHSEAEKNILLSYIFYPEKISVRHSFYFNMWVSVTLLEVLQKYNITNASVKWPNDIYVRDKKIAGILIQNTLRLDSIKNCIVSIGFNINQEFFPGDIPNPTSMQLETGIIYNRKEIIDDIHFFLENSYINLADHIKSGKLYQRYSGNLFGKSAFQLFKKENGEIIKRKVSSVMEDGVLLLTDENGLTENYLFRQVEWVKTI